MRLDDVLLIVGGRGVTVLETVLLASGLALVLLLAILVTVWRAGSRRHDEVVEAQRRARDLETRLGELAGQLAQFSQSAAMRETQMRESLDARLDRVSHRLGEGLTHSAERTGKSLQHLYERLAVIDTAQKKITDLSDEMLSLKDILANKQTRGAFGQARMEAIIRDGLPDRAFSFQTTLSNGTRPDCLVRLPENDQQIVIDSKFPLEAYNALKSAENEQETVLAERQLRKDIKQHIKDISSKYLIAGETHETAIMFVPSESVYIELHEVFEELVTAAHKARVVLASPNVLMLIIQTLQALFKDARMREQASLIQKEVILLLEDVGRFQTRLGDLKTHFRKADEDIGKLTISADKITKRGERIEEMELDDEAPDELSKQTGPKLVAGAGGG